jgi:hypothetical protein
MAEATAKLLFERIEMAAHDGDGAEEIPDDAVTHDVSPVQTHRHRLPFAVDNHRHHVAGA